jgi:hypothetical protein
MRFFRCSYLFLILLLLPVFLNAQPPTLYQLEFNKDYITWVWLGRFNTTINTGGQSRLTISDQFISKLFRQTAQTDKWRDENTFFFNWQTSLSAEFQPRTILQSRVFSDENTNREFNKHLAAQEVVIKAHPKIQFIPGLGYAMEKAFNSHDDGIHYRLGFRISALDMGGYINHTDLSSMIFDFPGRKNQEHSFFTGWTRKFSDYADDSLQVGYQFSESRYYINPVPGGPANPTEQVIINARFLFNKLQYKISDRSFFSVLTNFRNRDIDQTNPFQENNRRRKEFSLNNQFEFLLLMGPFNLLSSFFTSVIDHNNDPGLRTDVRSLQSALNMMLQFQPGRSDKFWGRFSYTKLEYNTPDVYEGINDDPAFREDRDEQRFIFDAGYRRRLSSNFALSFKGNAYLFHQIYLRPRRSQNNNWNRIYQLGVAADHKVGETFEHRSQVKILANYTVFDFEELLPNINSFVFRKLIYNDSLSIRLTRELSLNTIYQWEKEDNGRFFQEAFTQQVTKELTAHFVNIYFRHDDVFGLRVTSGVSLFFRNEWSFPSDGGRQKVREFRSITPRLTVIYPAGKRLMLYLTYAPNRATNFGRVEQYFTSGAINMQYFF